MKIWKTESGYEVFQLLSGRCNVFLLSNGKKNVLIDTGRTNKFKTLVKTLNSLNISHIDYIVLTHTHFDHAENAHALKDKYKSTLIVHKSEANFLNHGEGLASIHGTNFLTHGISHLLANTASSFLHYVPCKHDLTVDGILDLKSIGFNAFIMHTPGHSAGSISVIIDDELAIVGDAMFGVFKWTVFPPFADNIQEMVRSWAKLLDTRCSVFIPAHGTANDRRLVEESYNKHMRDKNN